jgi:hypothetical protein
MYKFTMLQCTIIRLVEESPLTVSPYLPFKSYTCILNWLKTVNKSLSNNIIITQNNCHSFHTKQLPQTLRREYKFGLRDYFSRSWSFMSDAQLFQNWSSWLYFLYMDVMLGSGELVFKEINMIIQTCHTIISFFHIKQNMDILCNQ